MRQPCPSCPWRVDQDATSIPNFRLALAENLASTCPDARGYGPSWGASMFACHQSKVGEEIICAGWLATVGHTHPQVRIMVMQNRLTVNDLRPGEGWPELHDNYQDMIEKLRATTVAESEV